MEASQSQSRRLATFLNWCVVVVAVCVAFHLFITAYFAEYGVPQWMWDVYDWKVWPLEHFRTWRNSYR